LTDYCFKGLFGLREKLAQRYDVNPDYLCDMAIVYLLGKMRPLSVELAMQVID
jgi:hypothetical protein